MYEEEFQLRLSKLRNAKNVSARDMSLSIGQNPGYINNIESGKAMPSMTGFFYICEYLNISPRDFFDTDSKNPELLNELIEHLKFLDNAQLEHILAIVRDLTKS